MFLEFWLGFPHECDCLVQFSCSVVSHSLPPHGLQPPQASLTEEPPERQVLGRRGWRGDGRVPKGRTTAARAGHVRPSWKAPTS